VSKRNARSPERFPPQGNRSVRAASDGNRHAIEVREGPLPDPEAFARYEAIVAGAADRILRMAEQQAQHRQHLESLAIPAGIAAERRGQRNGLIIAVTGLGATIALAAIGSDAVAGVVGGSTLLGMVTVFVAGRAAQSKERQRNR
jgi:uncharacterized membrane protein